MRLSVAILTEYPSENGPVIGGIFRSINSIINSLIEKYPDVSIHVITLTSHKKQQGYVNKDNLHIHYIYFPLSDYPLFTPNIIINRLLMKKIKEIDPDIIHAQGIGKFALFAVKQKNYPVVVTVHGIIFKEAQYWTGILGHFRAKVNVQLEKNILSRAENVISVSSYVKTQIQELSCGKITVIYNPVEQKFFSVQKNEINNRILFVGGIEERKGLEYLLFAVNILIKEIPDLQVHIVGNIRKKAYFNYLNEIISKYKLNSNITFLGHLSETELMEEYSKASIFVLPSREESFGIVLVEAMATSTPVIASNIGAVSEIINDQYDGLLVNSQDYQMLADSIKRLLIDNNYRKKIGMLGKNSATNFLPHIIGREHYEYYKKIICDKI